MSKQIFWTLLLVSLLIFKIGYSQLEVYPGDPNSNDALETTNLIIKKLDLKIIVEEDIAKVLANYVLFNPDSDTKRITLGFPHNPLNRTELPSNVNLKPTFFEVSIAQTEIDFDYGAAPCKGCRLAPRKLQHWVFFFEVLIEPGENNIQIKYDTNLNNFIGVDEQYSYRLDSGTKWGNGEIEELNFELDYGNDSYFYVSNVFDEKAEWKFTKNGRRTGGVINGGKHYDDEIMVYVSTGMLKIKSQNLNAKGILAFGKYQKESLVVYRLNTPDNTDNFTWRMLCSMASLEADLSKSSCGLNEVLSKNEIEFCKNYVFARYGYKFRDEKLLAFYKQFDWYLPNETLSMNEIKMTEKEKSYFEALTQLEQRF